MPIALLHTDAQSRYLHFDTAEFLLYREVNVFNLGSTCGSNSRLTSNTSLLEKISKYSRNFFESTIIGNIVL